MPWPSRSSYCPGLAKAVSAPTHLRSAGPTHPCAQHFPRRPRRCLQSHVNPCLSKTKIDSIREYLCAIIFLSGEMAERMKALVSKTSMGVISSRVRIPLSPPPQKAMDRPTGFLRGEVLERTNRHDWKSCVLHGTMGSNPILSATFLFPSRALKDFFDHQTDSLSSKEWEEICI